MAEIWIVCEHDGASLTGLAHELAAGARVLDPDAVVKAVVLSGPDADLTPSFAGLDVDGVLHVRHPDLAEFTPDGYAAAIQDLAEDRGPEALLFGHTTSGYSVAPVVALRLGVGCVTNVIEMELEDGTPVITRPVYNRKIHSRERLRDGTPWVLTVQEGAYGADPSGDAGPDVESIDAAIPDDAVRWTVEPPETQEKGDVDISEADVVVSGGRGLQEKENFAMLRQLADLLDGVVAGSRPVVDDEWLPRDRQVGTSGKTVKPDLYFAIGISGAIQHIVGMKGSRCIVAINKDPDAPIFGVAHYGIVDDLFDVVPALIEHLQEG